MPIYTYECTDHGEFDDIRPIRMADEPAECPVCGAKCQRTFTVPSLRVLDATTRRIHATNEKSRHEPTFKRRHTCGHNHAHGESCGHTHTHEKTSEKNGGLRPYTGPRPWVVEHPRS